jgi:acyl dehydratase
MTEVTDGRRLSERALEEMLARERAKLGTRIFLAQPHIEVASNDAIRHWARGIGDMNPLWTDAEYAASTAWGDLLAPPTIVATMMQTRRGLPGLHAWHLHTSFEWHDVIRRDTEFDAAAYYDDLREVMSRYAGGKAYDQVMRIEVSDRADQRPLCTIKTTSRRFEREGGASARKYTRAKQRYTDDEIAGIATAYKEEKRQIRGATRRYVEDVAEGEDLPSIVRGPLTVQDCIAFVIGWGGAYIFAHGFAYDFLEQHPAAFPRNSSNIPDTPERTHWIDEFAQAIGAPAAFDYGPARIAWCGTLVTNWMGDEGVLRRLHPRILLPNFHGDTITIGGSVTKVDKETGKVHIDIRGENQLGEVVVDGQATVELPSRP